MDNKTEMFIELITELAEHKLLNQIYQIKDQLMRDKLIYGNHPSINDKLEIIDKALKHLE